MLFIHTKWNAMQLLIRFLPTVTLVAVCFVLQAQTFLEKADKQFDMHAYRLAAKSYETLLTRDPNDLAVAARLAEAYFHLNELDDAARWYAKSIKSPTVKPAIYLNYGKVLMMLGQYDNAEAQFNMYRKTDAAVAGQYIKSCRFARNTEDNNPDFKVTPLNKANTASSEMGVTVYDNQLIWSSNRVDMKRARETSANNWSGATNNQLFSSPIEPTTGNIFNVSFFKNDLKNGYNESHLSYSTDGKFVVFMRNNLDDGERITADGGMELSLFTANINADGNWTDVKAFVHNGTGFSTGFPSLSADGNTLYFASNRSGGQGGFDIYSCTKRGNNWSEPRNLGANINTAGDEITPFIDGNTLYFASDFQTGYGGYDIFRTDVSGSEPINLGTSINTSGDDYGLVFHSGVPGSQSGYFISNRKGGKGKEDIYRFDKQIESANIIIVENGSPIADAKVRVTQGNEKNLSQVKTGNWFLNLNDGKTYTLEVKKDGFKTQNVTVTPRFVKTTQIIEVALERDLPIAMNTTPQYKGYVLDGSTGDGLEDVLIRVTNQATNKQVETKTDRNGQYKLTLSSSAIFLITYSKENFVIGKKTIKTLATAGTNRKIEDITLAPSAVTNRTELVANTEVTNIKSVPTPVDVPTSYSNNDKPQERLVKKSSETKVFSVQLLVSSSDDVLNLSQYDKFKSLGNIYIAPENGMQKVRLGVFKSKEIATTALNQVKAEGINNAYIVEEISDKAVNRNLFTPKTVSTKATTEKELPQPKDNPNQPKAKSTDKTPKALPKPQSYSTVAPPKSNTQLEKPVVADKSFKVKIAAMKKPEWFDDSKVATIWKVEQIKEGEFTVFFMDGIKTLQQAKDIKNRVKSAGYADAKVVIKEGNKFKVVD